MKLTRVRMAAVAACCVCGALLAPVSPSGPGVAAALAAEKPAAAEIDRRQAVRSIRVEGFHRVEESAIRIHISQPTGVPATLPRSACECSMEMSLACK